ncbi:hypothetical protein MSAN_02302300 [Mycena sanguinolenta]|uniref:Uncharacterized protein n=1 Tax=Mycena sanguinolenta TaxID=230812 RepID=A0A8H7CHG1_9AGAR|nr:hypothetical protein MSAN_02302300 [Mycena sanguinolenta]
MATWDRSTRDVLVRCGAGRILGQRLHRSAGTIFGSFDSLPSALPRPADTTMPQTLGAPSPLLAVSVHCFHGTSLNLNPSLNDDKDMHLHFFPSRFGMQLDDTLETSACHVVRRRIYVLRRKYAYIVPVEACRVILLRRHSFQCSPPPTPLFPGSLRFCPPFGTHEWLAVNLATFFLGSAVCSSILRYPLPLSRAMHPHSSFIIDGSLVSLLNAGASAILDPGYRGGSLHRPPRARACRSCCTTLACHRRAASSSAAAGSHSALPLLLPDYPFYDVQASSTDECPSSTRPLHHPDFFLRSSFRLFSSSLYPYLLFCHLSLPPPQTLRVLSTGADTPAMLVHDVGARGAAGGGRVRRGGGAGAEGDHYTTIGFVSEVLYPVLGEEISPSVWDGESGDTEDMEDKEDPKREMKIVPGTAVLIAIDALRITHTSLRIPRLHPRACRDPNFRPSAPAGGPPRHRRGRAAGGGPVREALLRVGVLADCWWI